MLMEWFEPVTTLDRGFTSIKRLIYLVWLVKQIIRRIALSNEFKPGDKVEWKSSQGKIQGTVKKKLTEPMEIKGHHVAATEAEPEYLVESDKTGKQAAHKPQSLKAINADSDR